MVRLDPSLVDYLVVILTELRGSGRVNGILDCRTWKIMDFSKF